MTLRARMRAGMAMLVALAVGMGMVAPAATAASIPTSSAVRFTEIDGKKVVGATLPNLVIGAKSIWVTGTAKVGATVTVAKRSAPTAQCRSKADLTGRWSCSLPLSVFGLSTDSWSTTTVVASATVNGLATTAEISVRAKLPAAPTPQTTITQVDGKAVANGKTPNIITDKTDIWITGQSLPGTPIVVTKQGDGTQSCQSTADKNGRWSCSLPIAVFNVSADTWTTTILSAATTLPGAGIGADVSVTMKAKASVPAPAVSFEVLTLNGVAIVGHPFTDTVVIENDGVVTVTGTAPAGTEVTVSGCTTNMASPTATTIADAAGVWSVPLDCKAFEFESTLDYKYSRIYARTTIDGIAQEREAWGPFSAGLNQIPSIRTAGYAQLIWGQTAGRSWVSTTPEGRLGMFGAGPAGSTVTVGMADNPAVTCTVDVDERGRWDCEFPANTLPLELGQATSGRWTVKAKTAAGTVVTGTDVTLTLQILDDPAQPVITLVDGKTFEQDHSGFFIFDLTGRAGATVSFVGTAAPGAVVTVRGPTDALEDEVCSTTATSEGTWTCEVTLPPEREHYGYSPSSGELTGYWYNVWID